MKALQWKNENKLMPYNGNFRDSYDINTLLILGENVSKLIGKFIRNVFVELIYLI